MDKRSKNIFKIFQALLPNASSINAYLAITKQAKILINILYAKKNQEANITSTHANNIPIIPLKHPKNQQAPENKSIKRFK